MTSLIDVIFLLLLFFMLTSTFSRFSEVTLPIASTGAVTPSEHAPLFLRLTQDTITLNGETISQEILKTTLQTKTQGVPQLILIATGPAVTSQRLVDLLAGLRGIPDITLNVLVPT